MKGPKPRRPKTKALVMPLKRLPKLPFYNHHTVTGFSVVPKMLLAPYISQLAQT